VDSIIENVWYDNERRALGALIWHASFEVVPDGEHAPRVQEFVTRQMMRRKDLGAEFELPLPFGKPASESWREKEPLL
jgi:hypothetical protein